MPNESSPGIGIETLVDRYGDLLYRYAVTRVGDPNTAEDLVQETFLAALRAPDSFGGRSAPQTWLVGILKHKIADHYRQQCRECSGGAGGDGGDGSDGDRNEPFFKLIPHWKRYPKRWAPDAASLMENSEFWAAFERCRAALPPGVGRAFCLRVVDEKDSDEVCQELGVTSTNLWVMLHRARARLRECLEKSWFRKD